MPNQEDVKKAILAKKQAKNEATKPSMVQDDKIEESTASSEILAPLEARKFILVSNDSSGLGFGVQEVFKNGSKVILALKPKEPIEDLKKKEAYDIQGKGIMETTTLDKIMVKRGEYRDYYWIWDGNHNFEESEKLRSEGFKVFGGSKFQYDLENDREFGLQFAESAGLVSPPFQEFKSAEEGIKFLEEHEDQAYVVKPNGAEDSSLTEPFSRQIEPKHANIAAQKYIQAFGFTDYILQERKKGVEVNVEIFMSQGIPVLAQANLECKKRHNGDLGYACGCAQDVCWIISLDSKLVKMTADKLVPKFLEVDPTYTGFIDANVIIGEDQVWFLEFCARFGYNAHCNFFSTLSKKTALQSVADLLDGIMVETKKGFGASVTLVTDKEKFGLPIYVPESILDSFYLFDGYRDKECEEGQFYMGGYGSEVGICTAHNYTIPTAFQDAIANAWKVTFRDQDFRWDGDKTDYPTSPIRRYEALQSLKLL